MLENPAMYRIEANETTKESFARGIIVRLTECSSCLTSMTVPSLKVHLTTSVSSEAPLTYSEPLRADQNLEKSWILMRCQTWDRGALMTADSVTEVEVWMADMLKSVWGDWGN